MGGLVVAIVVIASANPGDVRPSFAVCRSPASLSVGTNSIARFSRPARPRQRIGRASAASTSTVDVMAIGSACIGYPSGCIRD
ncbi:hypothetical protein [Burkholderia sp. BCC1644]|uniref:hypothetical protein n=1 Tax=Burkholderia sp. BCC1644 TaxID=2676293 RepID=UPI001FC8CFA0|nr:hypothetical protein [Burkholderia sp. BCC1644]